MSDSNSYFQLPNFFDSDLSKVSDSDSSINIT